MTPHPGQHASAVTIVMYHYVRPLADTPYPEIKGLDLSLFKAQLDYLTHHYSFISYQQLLEAWRGNSDLPPRPCLLTFDDGYADHARYAHPELHRRGISGVFFPPASTVLEHTLLDVNRVHFILAASTNPEDLIDKLETQLHDSRAHTALPSTEDLRARYWQDGTFDLAPIIYFKRLLQHALPSEVRTQIARQLFRETVSDDEADFAGSLYCSLQDLREMSDAGHTIGSHGDQHHWLSQLSADEQRQDITRSLRLLQALDLPQKDFAFCYPYGDYNDASLAILKELGAGLGFTTQFDLARAGVHKALELPRLDTNHLPKQADASINAWTEKAV